MRGWKAVERVIEPAVPFALAKDILQEQGFQLHVSNPSHAIFKSRGTKRP